MIAKPQRGDDILAVCQGLWNDLQPVLKAVVGPGMSLRKMAPAWLFDAFGAAAAEMNPWTPYVSPDAGKNSDGTPNPAAWRTVRIHGGKIDGVNPRSNGDDSLSDDTDLDASATTYIVAVQTRHVDTVAAVEADPEADPPVEASAGHNAGDIISTYLFFTTDTPPFPGWSATLGAEIPDIFRNAFFRTIAKIVTGSEDDPEADGYHRLTIFQGPDAHLTTGFTLPAF